jgi:hypothetical protein
MILAPVYEWAALLAINDVGHDPLTPITRLHRRLATLLSGLDGHSWATPSRCDGWAARNVAAHLNGVTRFCAALTVGAVPTRRERDSEHDWRGNRADGVVDGDVAHTRTEVDEGQPTP